VILLTIKAVKSWCSAGSGREWWWWRWWWRWWWWWWWW